jgi:hypothetical protein
MEQWTTEGKSPVSETLQASIVYPNAGPAGETQAIAPVSVFATERQIN